VGLRWWNEVDENDDEDKFFFECRVDENYNN
jgi:hypothetical protein